MQRFGEGVYKPEGTASVAKTSGSNKLALAWRARRQVKPENGSIDAGLESVGPHRSLDFILNVIGSLRKVLND